MTSNAEARRRLYELNVQLDELMSGGATGRANSGRSTAAAYRRRANEVASSIGELIMRHPSLIDQYYYEPTVSGNNAARAASAYRLTPAGRTRRVATQDFYQ